MSQYGLSTEEGHSFPESFVPCAYGYYWNPEGEYSTGSVMSEAGVKYVNTLFDEIRELNPPAEPNGGGFDNGVLVVNRINYGNEWYALSSLPTIDIAEQESDIIESHWSNWLAQDAFLQKALTNKWIEYYKMVQATPNRYIAKNTAQFFSQWLYKKYTQVNESKDGQVEIDNRNMPAEYYKHNLLGNMVLKVRLDKGQHVSMATLNNGPVASYFEEAGYGFLYLPRLDQGLYILNYKLSDHTMPFTVFNDGTYNVYRVTESKNLKSLDVKVYGSQEIKIFCSDPRSVESENTNLKIVGTNYNKDTGMLAIRVNAHNIQGEEGLLNLNY
jgi:hypothetical protein